ncbi:Cof-type HAD-IIB family hydrolase (plasmid) [Coraliomargarita sp. W4R53]
MMTLEQQALPNFVDLRLVAVDMDGTLLGADGKIPDALWSMLVTMRERGIVFAPASGRQYATLRKLFERDAVGMPFIAENGAFVVRDDEAISSAAVGQNAVSSVLDAIDHLSEAGGNVGVVLCGEQCAFVERSDEPFLKEVRKYYASLEIVDNLRAVDVTVIKVAVFDFEDAVTSAAQALESIGQTHQVVVSGAHWVDVMASGVNKGIALQALQAELSVTAAQTAAFGDYLNDLELLQAADMSFAMENAHPRIKQVARYQAPHHTEAGVITVLTELLSERTN